MKFHLIHNSKRAYVGQTKETPKLFESACANLSIDFVSHDIQETNLSELPVLGTNDLLYLSAISNEAIEAQRRMIGPGCTSFHDNWRNVFSVRAASYFLHKAHGLPVIPSFSGIPGSEEELQKCIGRLGPFPIIIKVTGGSLGVGVMRVDSLESMRSVLEYLQSLQVNVLVRKFIEHEYYVRAVVVGDKVVASHATFNMSGEFRTNAGDDALHKREARVLSAEEQAMAVEAVRLLGIETGGVDLLFDKEGSPFIAEVNFPNNFTTTQSVTGVNIASEMVAYLAKKAKRRLDVRVTSDILNYTK